MHKMTRIIFLCILIYSYISLSTSQEIDLENNSLPDTTIQFLIQYVNWRRIEHIVIFDSIQKGNIPLYLLQLLDCLSRQGIYTSLYSNTVKFLPDMFRVDRHRLGVIVLLNFNETIDYGHVLMKASLKHLFIEQLAWLVISDTPKSDDSTINIIKSLNIGLTSDFVIAMPLKNYTETGKQSSNSSCPIEIQELKQAYDSFNKELKVHHQPPKRTALLPAYSNGMSNDIYSNEKLERFSMRDLLIKKDKDMYYDIIQIYKIRREEEDSAVLKNLGSWGPNSHFENVKPFFPVDERQDLMGLPLVVGFRNWTSIMESINIAHSGNTIVDTDVDDTANLMEIMGFIAKSLNATVKYVSFKAVGQEIQDGVWSDMLNAVVKGEIDFGLEKVTITYHKLNHMAFTHNILKMSHNIYMHPSEFSVSRDIYLTPFSPKLLLCVLGMAILLALIMLIIASVAKYRTKHKNLEPERINISYAALWIVGILSMQGSIWSPISSSGNMTLISSLMFALIIYNSYAAFITSILSVKTSDINTLADLFANGYKVGYIQNSQDETYLQRQTGELKKIYLQGYDSKVEDINEGLLLAANTKYALFVSAQAARRAIQYLNPYECRCQIQEFALRSTIEDVAFPLKKFSPYHKVINLGVMRLIESGTLSRIQGYMMPNMPTCNSDSSFVSAQFEDVFTAVELLIVGFIASIFIGITECVIKYRKQLRSILRRKTILLGSKISDAVKQFEF